MSSRSILSHLATNRSRRLRGAGALTLTLLLLAGTPDAGISEFLRFGFNFAPRTVLEGIFKLEPGGWLSAEGGRVSHGRFAVPPMEVPTSDRPLPKVRGICFFPPARARNGSRVPDPHIGAGGGTGGGRQGAEGPPHPCQRAPPGGRILQLTLVSHPRRCPMSHRSLSSILLLLVLLPTVDASAQEVRTYLRFQGDDGPRWGLLLGEEVQPLEGVPFGEHLAGVLELAGVA